MEIEIIKVLKVIGVIALLCVGAFIGGKVEETRLKNKYGEDWYNNVYKRKRW